MEERVGTATTADKQYVYHPHYVDAIALSYDSAGVEHYYLQDANFNVTAITENTGTVVERYAYTPYGEVTVLNPDFSAVVGNTSAISNELLYTGRRLDPETGLQLNRNRFYHQQLGRWVNRDPIGYDGSQWSLYEYVNGMPLIWFDPDGLLTCKEKCGLAAGACTAGCTLLSVNHALHCHALLPFPPLYAGCLVTAASDLIACNIVCAILAKACADACDEPEECPPSMPGGEHFGPGSERPPGMPPVDEIVG